MDTADPDFAWTDPTYTLSLHLFEHLLDFLLAHYKIVNLAEVMAAYDGVKPLADYSVLITFDDGWADNLRYAAPVLQRLGLPAVVFTVAEPVSSLSDAWWQERVFAAARSGSLADWLSQRFVKERIFGPALAPTMPLALGVVTQLGLMEEDEREALLGTLAPAPCRRRMMLEPADLRKLADLGIDVALHGYKHLPLTSVPDVAAELGRARDQIAMMSDGTSIGTALGCPHGRYDDRVIAGARAAGIKLMFTSDPYLNPTYRGMLRRDRILGRINVIARHIESGPGQFDPSATARWLWARETR